MQGYQNLEVKALRYADNLAIATSSEVDVIEVFKVHKPFHEISQWQKAGRPFGVSVGSGHPNDDP